MMTKTTSPYRVAYLPFPDTVRGCVHLCDDGSYIIGINQALTDQERRKVLQHELEHIKRDHFHDPRTIEKIEAEAAAFVV